jgi:hypothetical protein
MSDNAPTTDELAAWRALAEVVSVGINKCPTGEERFVLVCEMLTRARAAAYQSLLKDSDSAADAAELLMQCWNESRAGGVA